MLEIESGQIEGLYVANQILLEDMFIQTANYGSLQRHGDEYGLPMKIGTPSNGQLLFTGQGGTDIFIGTEVAYDPGSGADVLYFITTQEGIVPNPGAPTAPTLVDAGAGTMAAGTYEYAVTFLTTQGESLIGPESAPLTIAVNRNITVNNIPLGGPGTIGRSLYQSLNGGPWQKVTTAAVVAALANNTATTVTLGAPTLGGAPPAISTAERILLNAESEDNGISYNAVSGAITVLSQVPDGITAVTNPAPFSGGGDEESIDDYRTRLLTFIRSPVTGAASDLVTWATAISGVESATVFPNDNLGVATPGHVTVRISGPNGTVPPQSVIDAVAADLSARDLASITVHVTTFTVINLAVSVAVTVQAGYVKADLIPNIQAAITKYVNNVPVGGTVFLTGIIAAVMSVTGVADVTVSAPATNQVAAATSKFVASPTPVVT